VSTGRTLLAAVLGLALGWAVGLLLDRNSDITTDDAVVTGTVLALLFTMIVVIGFELASAPSRPGSRDARSNPVTAVRNSWNDTRRASEIVDIARRSGLFTSATRVFSDDSDHRAEVEFGRSLRLTLEELGGVYVKLGQILSTRPDVLPPAALEELSRLQGDVAPTPRDVMAPHLESALGRPVLEVFSEFDWDPIGSASIGKVYRARLRSGEQVVVKVRRPGVAETIERDLGVIMRVAETLERRTEFARTYGTVSFARGFATTMRSELDDGHEVAGDLFQAQLGAMVEGGEFHADPHPGNVIVMGPGQLGLIDFGSTGRLDAFERGAVTDILTALQMRDPTLLREAITQVAVIPDDTSPEALERSLARLLADRLAPGMEPTPELITDFRPYEMLGLLGLVMGSVLLMRVVLEALEPDP
jgi:ubiquinone biosynthesis protein